MTVKATIYCKGFMRICFKNGMAWHGMIFVSMLNYVLRPIKPKKEMTGPAP
jgi:hypothetical protein